MARKKCFRYGIPSSIVEIVESVCADYERRERIIKNGTAVGPVLECYIKLNNTVDKALEDIEIAIRKDILNDIVCRRGYDFSSAAAYISKGGYYRRKQKFIHDVAIALCLI